MGRAVVVRATIDDRRSPRRGFGSGTGLPAARHVCGVSTLTRPEGEHHVSRPTTSSWPSSSSRSTRNASQPSACPVASWPHSSHVMPRSVTEQALGWKCPKGTWPGPGVVGGGQPSYRLAHGESTAVRGSVLASAARASCPSCGFEYEGSFKLGPECAASRGAPADLTGSARAHRTQPKTPTPHPGARRRHSGDSFGEARQLPDDHLDLEHVVLANGLDAGHVVLTGRGLERVRAGFREGNAQYR